MIHTLAHSKTKRSTRGFASLAGERRREIAAAGGRAAQARGAAHQWSPDEARKYARDGVKARRLEDSIARNAEAITAARARLDELEGERDQLHAWAARREMQRATRACAPGLPVQLSAHHTRLSDRERLVLELRQAGETLRTIGRQIGVSHERVRQIEAKARRTRASFESAADAVSANIKDSREATL